MINNFSIVVECRKHKIYIIDSSIFLSIELSFLSKMAFNSNLIYVFNKYSKFLTVLEGRGLQNARRCTVTSHLTYQISGKSPILCLCLSIAPKSNPE